MRIALLSDIHGNHLALRAIQKILIGRYDELVVLGDVLGYFPFFMECLDILREMGARCIKGNHEAFELEELPQPEHRIFQEYRELFRKSADADARAWLAELENSISLDTKMGRILFCHGSPWSAAEYIYAKDGLDNRFDNVDADVIAMGHTHLEMLVHSHGKLLINPGSVGLPRNKNYHASFAVIDTSRQEVVFRQQKYNFRPLLSFAAKWNLSSCFSLIKNG